MSEDSTAATRGATAASRPGEGHQPPAGAEHTAAWNADGRSLAYRARGGWTLLGSESKPDAELFSVSYVVEEGDEDRPVTFVFNGGPGAASAYLHMGAVGPSRVMFGPGGALPAMPPRLAPNAESWLAFTDLIFVDPVGTGFSRAIPEDRRAPGAEETGPGGSSTAAPETYFGYQKDLESLCEFMGRWLSEHRRWGSPVFLAGESYGGYRVGRLVRMAQETAGIGLSGAILISPAMELTELTPNDYDVLTWIDLIPTMALTAVHHGRSRAFEEGVSAEEIIAQAEVFASTDYAALLTRGAALPVLDRQRIFARLADLIGLPVDLVARSEGRVDISSFTRELLRDQRRVLGLYDATVTTVDPFPDRRGFEGPDPTLAGSTPAYTAAINRQLRQEIGVRTDREYVLLSQEVNEKWKNDDPEHFFAPPRGATDDFRYGMTLNPYLRAFITHGRYDLVTPFAATDRLVNLMRLDPSVAERLTVQHFDGGHMFYAWESSRVAFTRAIARFYAEALAG